MELQYRNGHAKSDLHLLLRQNAETTKLFYGDRNALGTDQGLDQDQDQDPISFRLLADYGLDQSRAIPLPVTAARKAPAGTSAPEPMTTPQPSADARALVRTGPNAAARRGSVSSVGRAHNLEPSRSPSVDSFDNGRPQSWTLARKPQSVDTRLGRRTHAKWKLDRVIAGHLGWVRSITLEPMNQWFATGAGDRTIKIWDLASGQLRLTLTGHVSTVRGLAVSLRSPYLFSCGEDKQVKCWDLETNKVIRHYHGHLSAVSSLALHPTLDVLVTAGRDAVARVWDIRTRSNIMVLSGHTAAVADVKCQQADPQVITSSLDATVRLWDLAAGKASKILTHHKKGVRALALHPTEFTFASGSNQSVKKWRCPEGAFLQNFDGHNAIINTLAANADDVLFSGGDDGSMSFWDWQTGRRVQSLDTTAQPGSLDAEHGIMCSAFDLTGQWLICGETDKTIKVWKQVGPVADDGLS